MDHAELTGKELERYSRQLVLGYIGYEGQLRLKRSKVCIVGVGGIGSPAAMTLAAMGVGHIRIVDRDVVSISDFHRQRFYDENSIGIPKVEALEVRIKSLNPSIKVEGIASSISSRNVEGLIEDVDVVIDGLDSIETRYIVNRAVVNRRKPYVFAAAIETIGVVSSILPYETGCLECFYSGLQDDVLPKCAIVGVMPPVIDAVSGIQVSEVLRILLGKTPMLKNKLLYIDLEKLSFDFVDVSRVPECPVCGDGRSKPREIEEKIISGACARDGHAIFMVNVPSKVDMEFILNNLRRAGIIPKKITRLSLSFDYGDKVTISVLKDGVTIIQSKPNSGIYDEYTAMSLYLELVERFDLPKP